MERHHEVDIFNDGFIYLCVKGYAFNLFLSVYAPIYLSLRYHKPELCENYVISSVKEVMVWGGFVCLLSQLLQS